MNEHLGTPDSQQSLHPMDGRGFRPAHHPLKVVVIVPETPERDIHLPHVEDTNGDFEVQN